MKEYLIMFLSLFRLAGKKSGTEKISRPRQSSAFHPARAFYEKGPMPCWAITAASAAAEIFL